MNTDIQQILNNDDQLFNRVYVYAPGDGLNRMMEVVEDATSIATYGARETTLELLEVADRADLIAQGNEYLATVASPAQDIKLTYYFYAGESAENLTYGGEIVTYNGEPVQVGDFADAVPLRRGDTIRVVSEDLGVAFTGVIAELDWSIGSVDIMIGTPPYNLLDVINGPEEDEERKKIALGLPVPIGFRAYRVSPGIEIRVNPYNNSRAVGIEIYASTVSPVASTRDKLLFKGPGTRFLFPELESGVLYYFKARSYDNEGNYSGFTDETSEIAGYIDGGKIEEGSIDITPFASDLRPPRNVVNLPALPSASYLEGDLVVYDDGDGPRLYENQSSSWVMLDAADLEDKTIAHQVVAGQIIAGAIGADEIAANAITAEKIAAGSITLDKFGSTSENKQSNPGFETGDLTGWTQVGTGGAWSVTSSDANSGVYSARATADGAAATQVLKSEQITVFPGEKIDVAFYHKSGTGNSAHFTPYVYWFDATDLSISFTTGSLINVSSSWDRASVSIGPAPANTAYAHVYISVGNEDVGQTFFVDDVNFAVAIDSSLAAGTSRIDGSGFETRDGAGALKTKMGVITGLGGVPSGVDYGFWGALGSGVFIQGAPRVLQYGIATWTGTGATVPAQDTYQWSDTEQVSGSFNIQSGKRGLFLISHNNVNAPFALNLSQFQISVGVDNTIPSGSYTTVNFSVSMRLYNPDTSGVSNVQPTLSWTWLLVEVDD